MTQIQKTLFPTCVIYKICACLLLFLSLSCATRNPALYPPRDRLDSEFVYLLDNHWHTAMIVPCNRLPVTLRHQLGNLAAGRYVAFGWGDEGFFRAPRINAPLVVQALFFSRGSVMQVFRLDGPPTAFARDISVYRLAVSHAGMDRMIEKISTTFVRHGGVIVDAGPTANDGRFYFANDRYNLFHTCNQWTADVLHTGGLPISAAYAGLASNFEWQLQQPGVVGVVEFRSADRPAE